MTHGGHIQHPPSYSVLKCNKFGSKPWLAFSSGRSMQDFFYYETNSSKRSP